MLQDDIRGLHPLGGMRILLLMPPQTLSPGTSSPPTSRATSSVVMKIKKKEFLSLKQGECQWQSTETSSLSCLAMPLRRLLKTRRSRSCSWMG
jgi:hypothetical protein